MGRPTWRESAAGLFAFLTMAATGAAAERPATIASAQAGVAQPVVQEPVRPESAPAGKVQAAIDKLGDLDYATRSKAARTIRRVVAAQAVPALIQAVNEHVDGFVRYRALVLLTGFNDPRTRETMLQVLPDPNDRLRTVAYSYVEHNPDPKMTATLLQAVDKEQAEFVRPALVRAMAAGGGDDPRVRAALLRDVTRGEDVFRSAVIEALGEYRATWAEEAIAAVARLDGPLQDDAALALGRIGDKRALEVLAGLQRTATRDTQPAVAAAICLLGVNCESHVGYLANTLRFGDRNLGYQNLLRSTAAALGAVATSGRVEAMAALWEIGIPAQDPVRAPVALAVGTVALRNPAFMLQQLEGLPDRARAIELLRDGFDMLEEDFEKERFFMTVRRAYWGAEDASPVRALTATLIGALDF